VNQLWLKEIEIFRRYYYDDILYYISAYKISMYDITKWFSTKLYLIDYKINIYVYIHIPNMNKKIY